MDVRMPQPLEPRLHDLAVVVEQRGLVRAGLARLERYPVAAVVGEQVAPFLEAALVEQPHFMDQEILNRTLLAKGGGRLHVVSRHARQSPALIRRSQAAYWARCWISTVPLFTK